MTISHTTARDALHTVLGDYPMTFVQKAPEPGASAAEIEASGIFAELTDRTAYVAWVAHYKVAMAEAEAAIRALKAARRPGNVPAAWTAQARHHMLAQFVTAAIAKRRLGKTWSAAQAKKLKSAA